MIYVPDASVVIKWYVPEVRQAQAQALIAQAADMQAPSFLLIEIASILWKKHRRGEFPAEIAGLILEDVRRLFADALDAGALQDRALTLAIALDHPVYDCLYLAAAEALDGVVVTDDRRFHAAVAAGGSAERIALLEALSP
ncbi:MAG: type II toxin-antitoxin system VapC family toxin [Alphaproteobacteria bacterium]|nr:type II toxin-antitoxin system VapC family toxin [Alphaproteobacteria bacterium]